MVKSRFRMFGSNRRTILDYRVVFFVFGCRTRTVVLAVCDYSSGKGVYFRRWPLQLVSFSSSSDRNWMVRVVGIVRIRKKSLNQKVVQ
jgi:hypothetical protein